jgi:hypothetical protein
LIVVLVAPYKALPLQQKQVGKWVRPFQLGHGALNKMNFHLLGGLVHAYQAVLVEITP